MSGFGFLVSFGTIPVEKEYDPSISFGGLESSGMAPILVWFEGESNCRGAADGNDNREVLLFVVLVPRSVSVSISSWLWGTQHGVEDTDCRKACMPSS